jgi:hypothetical protein
MHLCTLSFTRRKQSVACPGFHPGLGAGGLEGRECGKTVNNCLLINRPAGLCSEIKYVTQMLMNSVNSITKFCYEDACHFFEGKTEPLKVDLTATQSQTRD